MIIDTLHGAARCIVMVLAQAKMLMHTFLVLKSCLLYLEYRIGLTHVEFDIAQV